KTLEKVQWITRELEKIPGVDPYKIRSIAVSKMKDFKFSAGAMAVNTLMFPDVPKDEQEMQDLKDKIFSNPRYYGQYVAYDSKKTLITVDFFEEDLDYDKAFDALSRIREKTEDENHIISIAGEPMHLGFIKYHVDQVLYILIVTVLAMVIMLYIYYRSKRAMFVPVMTSATSAIWGLGFMAMLGYNLDPLIIILPFLISLMTARHSIQLVTRYMEEFGKTGCVKEASKNIIQSMLIPGLASIVTDALGIALVALAVIPALVNMAIVCSFWFLATTIMSLVMTPVVLSYIPSSERFVQQVNMALRVETQDYRYKFLNLLGHWIPQRGKWYVVAATILLTSVGWVYAAQIQIGDFFPGSSILWPFHRYNKDAFRITFSMPLLNPLYVIIEGDTGQFVTQGSTLREMNNFQRYMAKHDRVMFTYSIANTLPGFLMSSYEDDPQWNHLPKDDRTLSFIARRLVYAGEPGTWDQYIDMEDKNANIVIYCRDKMPATAESIIAYIKEYIAKTPGPPGGKYTLAGGAVGVQAAVREVIADSQLWNLILALGGVFFFCAITFRSLMAGLLLTIPLAISNVLTFALMGAYHIGLTVNTFPVSSVGIGIGVDYGIYYIGRLLEEREKGYDLSTVVCNGLTSNGRSIIQIATTLTIGLGLWVFSPLKFQAEMGALLAILLLLNMLGALLLVPAMICILKPKFLTRIQKAL
ncbi:MAG: MMPL family transporter, partial [Pseudomonadota bacterium]